MHRAVRTCHQCQACAELDNVVDRPRCDSIGPVCDQIDDALVRECLHHPMIGSLELLRAFRFCSAAPAPHAKPCHDTSVCSG